VQELRVNLQQPQGINCKMVRNKELLDLFSNGKLCGPGPQRGEPAAQLRSMVDRRQCGQEARWCFAGVGRRGQGRQGKARGRLTRVRVAEERWRKTHAVPLERMRELESERRTCGGGRESSKVYIGGRGRAEEVAMGGNQRC
jgi:hypothetical protein